MTLINSKISNKKLKISKVSQEVENLNNLIQSSKAQRDLHIGQNFINNREKIDKKLTESKNSMENILIHVKQDCGKLAEKVQEQEDLVQFLISSCRSFDSEIQSLKKELEKTKVISVPEVHDKKSDDHNNSHFLNSSFTMNQPIQLNIKKKLNRRGESLGGFS